MAVTTATAFLSLHSRWQSAQSFAFWHPNRSHCKLLGGGSHQKSPWGEQDICPTLNKLQALKWSFLRERCGKINNFHRTSDSGTPTWLNFVGHIMASWLIISLWAEESWGSSFPTFIPSKDPFWKTIKLRMSYPQGSSISSLKKTSFLALLLKRTFLKNGWS